MKDIDVNKIFEWTDVFYMPIFTIKGQYNVEITSSKLGLWRNTDRERVEPRRRRRRGGCTNCL